MISHRWNGYRGHTKKCNFVRIIEKEWCFWYLWRSGHCNHTSEQTHQTPSCASVLLSVFSLWFGRVCTFALVVISSSSLNWTDIIVFVSFRNIIWCKRNWCRCFRLAEKKEPNGENGILTRSPSEHFVLQQFERFRQETQWWLDLTGDRTCECEQWSQDSKVHDGCHDLLLTSKCVSIKNYVSFSIHLISLAHNGTSRQSRLIRADDARNA